MVPMDQVEDRLMAAVHALSSGDQEHDLAVVAVADRARGERLVLLYTSLPCEVPALLNQVSDLPPLYRPKERDAYQVEAIPVLGTGKRDLRKLRELAESLTA
jgi:acyl-[acyl-carrier-protein]-phospholipid O-acyltransferase/long-chain-fatty-acid--[acyl-carrier-protein] ligase